MSLLVCLRGADGLVLATDSRGTFGDPRGVTAQNDAQKKLYVTNDMVGVMLAGTGDIGAQVIAEFLGQPGVGELGITNFAMKLREIVRARFSQWFDKFSIQQTPQDIRPARPDLALIVAGYEENRQDIKIYQFISQFDFAPMLVNYGFALAGVAQYGLYLLNRLYDPTRTVEQLKHLAAYAITETASQDGKVGGPVQMATISPMKASTLEPAEVSAIVEANKARSSALKASFLGTETADA